MKKRNEKFQTADLFTELVLETFRFNGQLIAAGDKLTKELGLTSSLWQVLGAIRELPIPMAQIARNMGLSRQGVRRSAKVLMDKGLVSFEENPDHKRAKLVVPTEKGRKVLHQLEKIQIKWSKAVSKEFTAKEIIKVINTVKALSVKL
jgi:DNA-binding MarR family transcriptional regulator